MLDYFDDIVRRAFEGRSDKYFRTHGAATFFFHNVRVLRFDDDEIGSVPVITGRIVKDTTLHRDQVYVNGGLKATSLSIATAPSSFFLLILHNHRLVFVREMAGAPNLQQFALLLQENVRAVWNEFIRSDRDWNSLLRIEGKPTLKKIKTEIPRPSVEVVPLASDEEIDAQIGKFSILREISISFRGTNHEIDNSQFFSKWHSMFEDLDAEEANIKFKSADGLDKNKAKVETKDASRSGTQRVRLQGVDHQGGSLKIDEEDFRLSRPLSGKLGKKVPSAAKKLFEKFKQAAADGYIKVKSISPAVKDKIDEIEV